MKLHIIFQGSYLTILVCAWLLLSGCQSGPPSDQQIVKKYFSRGKVVYDSQGRVTGIGCPKTYSTVVEFFVNLFLIPTHCEINGPLPAEIGLLTELKTFGLRSASVTELPPEIGQLTQLELLTVGANPLDPPTKKVIMFSIEELLDYFEKAP